MHTNKEKVTFAENPMTLAGTEMEKGMKAENFTALVKRFISVQLSNLTEKLKFFLFPSIDTGFVQHKHTVSTKKLLH